MSQRIYLLDTSVILPLVRGNALGKHIDQRFGLQASAQRPFVSVVSLGEVRVLAKRNDWGAAKLRSLSNALDNLVVVDINHPSVIDAYVELDLVSQSHPDGARNMGKNDLWIAALCQGGWRDPADDRQRLHAPDPRPPRRRGHRPSGRAIRRQRVGPR